MKTNLELYRVVTGGYRWLRRLHRGCDDFSGQTDKQTLHHNIYIIVGIVIVVGFVVVGFVVVVVATS